MSKDQLSRRLFLRMISTLAATGVLAWASDKSKAEAQDKRIILKSPWLSGRAEDVRPKGILGVDPNDQPFAPYYLESVTSVSICWVDMEDGDTWGIPNVHED